jgi:hypothetical protein
VVSAPTFRERLVQAFKDDTEGWGNEFDNYVAGARAALLLAAEEIGLATAADRFSGTPPSVTSKRWETEAVLRRLATSLSCEGREEGA